MAPPSAFSSRFFVVAVRGDGIVLDLRSGEYSRVDGAGLVACRVLARGGSLREAAAEVARRFDVGTARAARDVRALVSALEVAPHGTGHSPMFRVSPRGFELATASGARIVVERDGSCVTQRGHDALLLRRAAPHVLALRGTAVLHASSVLGTGGVIAFVGESGRGKSTLARLLGRENLRVTSTDLLALDGSRDAFVDSERAVHRWTRRRSESIVADPLEGAVERRPLARVLLLERAPIDRIEIDALPPIVAMASLFENAFVELPVPSVWTRALVLAASLVARGMVRRVRVPEGLANLRRAVVAWRSELDDALKAPSRRRARKPRVAFGSRKT